MDLQERIYRFLAACPPAVSGNAGHNQTFSVACALVNGFALSGHEALGFLKQYNDRCQPPWEEKDLQHKIESAINAQHSKARGHMIGGNGSFGKDDFKCTSFPAKVKAAPKPAIDPATAIEKFLSGFSCSESDLYDASPIKPSDDFESDGILTLQHLYRPGEFINFVADFKMQECKDKTKKAVPVSVGITSERDELIDLWSLGMPKSPCGGWLRMNPLDGNGVADKNVTAYRYILLEFDSIPLDLQISLFGRLPLPISVVLTSGGKSVHAWVRADSADATCYKDDAAMLLKMLEPYGLDAKNKNPSRLSRLPGVTRVHGASGDGRQRLLYLNPNPTQSRII